jgi:hypothetical protein
MTYASEQSTDSPIARWQLNESSGTAFTDDIGAKNGTLNGGLTLANTAVMEAGTGVKFDGSTGYISIGSMSGFLAVGTVEVVATFSALPASSQANPLFTHAYASSIIPLVIGFNLDAANAGKLQVGYFTGSAWMTATWATAPAVGVPYHFVGTYDGTTLNLWANNQLVATATPGTARPGSGTVNGTAYIGRRWDTAEFHNGYIYDVALYSSALNSTRVAAHYAAVSPLFSFPDVAGGSWTRQSVASSGSGEVVLVNGGSDSGSTLFSSDTFTWNNVSIIAPVSIATGADWMDIGILDSSDSTTVANSTPSLPFNGITGFYGVRLDVYNNQVSAMIAGTSTSTVGYAPNTGGVYETLIVDFIDNGSGSTTITLRRAAGKTKVASWTTTTPNFSVARAALGARSGGVSGVFKVQNTVTRTIPQAVPITTAPVVSAYVSNGAVYLTWTSAPNALSYDIYDGTTTVNITSGLASYRTGYTNGTPVTFTISGKNAIGNGPTGSATATPSTEVKLFDFFDRTATPPGNPDFGPAPSVQTTMTADGSALRSTGSGDSFIIWDITATDLFQIDAKLKQVDTGGTPEIGLVHSYTDSNNYSFVRWCIGGSQQASFWRKSAGSWINDLAQNVKFYDYTSSTLARNASIGDVLSVVVAGQEVRVLYNGVERGLWERPRVVTSNVGIRINGGTNWAFDWVRATTTTDTVAGTTRSIAGVGAAKTTRAGFIYRGRFNKINDSVGGVA